MAGGCKGAESACVGCKVNDANASGMGVVRALHGSGSGSGSSSNIGKGGSTCG